LRCYGRCISAIASAPICPTGANMGHVIGMVLYFTTPPRFKDPASRPPLDGVSGPTFVTAVGRGRKRCARRDRASSSL
jgi:hypothetical protein